MCGLMKVVDVRLTAQVRGFLGTKAQGDLAPVCPAADLFRGQFWKGLGELSGLERQDRSSSQTMSDLLYFFIAKILLPDALESKHELNCQVARASSLKVVGQPQILLAQQGFRRLSEVDSVKIIPVSSLQ